MVIADMQGSGKGVGTTRCAVTVAASVGAIVGSTVFKQGCSAQVNTQGRVVRLSHEARQTVMEKPERLEAVAFHQRVHGGMPEMAQRTRKPRGRGRTHQLRRRCQ